MRQQFEKELLIFQNKFYEIYFGGSLAKKFLGMMGTLSLMNIYGYCQGIDYRLKLKERPIS